MNFDDKIDNLMEKLDEVLLNQDRLERLFLTVTPYRRLPVDLQRRAAHLQNLADSERAATGDRVDTVKRMFAKLCDFTKSDMQDGRWPKILAHTMHPWSDGIRFKGGVIGAVPHSALVNRCVALKCFALAPGDVSPKASVEEAIRQAGLEVKTMHEAGLAHGSKVNLVMREKEGWTWKYGSPESEGVFVKNGEKLPKVVKEKWSGVEPEEDEEEDEKPTAEELARKAERRRLDEVVRVSLQQRDEEEPAKPAKPKKQKPNRWAVAEEPEEEPAVWGGIAVEPESFETSEAAQGIGTMKNRDDEEDDVIEEDEDLADTEDVVDEDETLTSTTDDVDHDLGPDEIEFSNPLREQFEREAEEAWAREEAALASGELVLVDGIPVARKTPR